jgi:hypothetical protein
MTTSAEPQVSRSSQRLGILYESYRRGGDDYRNHGLTLDGHWKSISGLPHIEGCAITRRSVLDAWSRAHSMESTKNALYETLIWGYGKDRYGPRNFGLIRDNLARNSRVFSELIAIREVAHVQPVEAFRNLLSLNITGLGFVYATKVIYAMGANAPILDRHIETWLRHFGEDLGSIGDAQNQNRQTRVQRYKAHLEWFHSVSEAHINDEIGSIGDIALVEYMMFWDSKSENPRARSQQPTWLKGVPRWCRS